MIGDIPLYPMSQLNMVYCNAIIDYTDVLLGETTCKKRILRTWFITEWWCSTAINHFAGLQIIDIVDDIAPIIPEVKDVTLTTTTRTCTAKVVLATLNITDNCNALYHVFINASNDDGPTGYIDGNGGVLELGIGTHEITYTALDICGNTRHMTYTVTVWDQTGPVSITRLRATS